MNATPPNQVKLAFNLIWLSLGVGVVRIFLRQPAPSPKFGMGFTAAAIMLMLAFLTFINFKIFTGRNWARILSLVLFAIGLPMSILHLGKVFNQSTFDGLAAVMQIGLQAAALYLVFLTEGKDWFTKTKTDKIDIVSKN